MHWLSQSTGSLVSHLQHDTALNIFFHTPMKVINVLPQIILLSVCKFSPENGVICKLTETLAYAGSLAQVLLQQVGEDLQNDLIRKLLLEILLRRGSWNIVNREKNIYKANCLQSTRNK